MQKIPHVKPATLTYPKAWYVGTSEEYMNIGGPFDTRDEAVSAGRHDQGGCPFYICEAAPYSWVAPDANDILDNWTYDHDELWFEDGFSGFDGPADTETKAHDSLQTVLNEWFEQHKSMLPTPTAFCIQAGGEWIDLPIKESSDASSD